MRNLQGVNAARIKNGVCSKDAVWKVEVPRQVAASFDPHSALLRGLRSHPNLPNYGRRALRSGCLSRRKAN